MVMNNFILEVNVLFSHFDHFKSDVNIVVWSM